MLLQLHRITGWMSGFFANMYYLTQLSAWVTKHRKIAYNDFPSKWDYQKRKPMYQWVIEQEKLTEPIDYLEFGVAWGDSFQWWLQQNSHPNSKFVGFDTFDGLPEGWGPFKKGSFSNGHEMPKISDSRGMFLKGLFQQTLPGFLTSHVHGKRKVIMMDADLYSATLYVLSSLTPYLQEGDIIFFDEFVVPTHEFKAYLDWVQSYYVELEPIAAANNYYFIAFKVKKVIPA